MELFYFVVILGLVYANIVLISNAQENEEWFNVLAFGAVPDGFTDSSQAFLNTWNAACNCSVAENTAIIVPRHRFIVNPVVFNGPCKAKNIKLQIFGVILAPALPKAWEGLDQSLWLAFNVVSGLTVAGPGWIDGRGFGWWNQSCRYHPVEGCTSLAPTAMKFVSCDDSSLRDLYFINSSQVHVSLRKCNGFDINSLKIEAPGSSPNTDGIHIQASQNVIISNCTIGTGDDCISIGDYTSNIHISYIRCGPGHGISIGSLGKSGNYVQVENIHVSRVYFLGASNGARIKTWQVGRGYVRGVTFENIYLNSVQNPIIIDQNYCFPRGSCQEQKTGVHISEVFYHNFYGTSSTDVAINLNCSKSVACNGILLKSIVISSAKMGINVTSSCNNAHGFSFGMVQPWSCLQH